MEQVRKCIDIERRVGKHLKHWHKCLTFQVLFRHVLSGEISVDRLVRMTPEQLASPELATWREQETKHVRIPSFYNKIQTTISCDRWKIGSISAALSCLVYLPREERGRSAGSFPEQRLVIEPRKREKGGIPFFSFPHSPKKQLIAGYQVQAIMKMSHFKRCTIVESTLQSTPENLDAS